MEPPETGSVLLRLAAVAGLVLANAFFVAAEFAFVGARRTRLEELARGGSRRAVMAQKAIQHINRYLSSAQLGITLASLGLGWIGEPAVASVLESAFKGLPKPLDVVALHSVAVTIAFALISILHIVLGEQMPKALALLHPERVSEWVVVPMFTFTWLMAIPTAFLNNSANRLLRLFRIRAQSPAERVHSPEELRMLVEQSQESGGLEKAPARLLEGVFEFSEKNAEDVMTPRTQMVAIAAESTVEEAADTVARAGRSRYPVSGESLDDIVGVVHAKDILVAVRQTPGAPVRTIMRPPLFVPSTREVEDVLADMKRLKVHLAVVLDEYGGTAGLVTMEDLLEEIVGPIYDEHDRPAPPPAPPGAPVLDGAMAVHEFNEQFAAQLDDTHYATLGGYLFGQLGRLPAPGDRVAADGRVFEIVEMDGRRVKSVRVVESKAGKA